MITHVARVMVGGLFIFSGFIKANDPLGFSYKLQEYFEVFQNDSGMAFFGWFAHIALPLAIIICASEIVLGVLLLLGIKRELTLWLLFAQIAFFTFLTFYSACYNKVTHCGCFGDFIKIVPKTSFLKDIFLMIPAILFLLYNKKFHKLLSSGTRVGISTVSFIAFLFYCLNYTYWNEPDIDFRPFKEGTNIREQKIIEQEAEASRPVFQVITPKNGGTSVTLSSEEYAKRWKEFPKEDFDIEQKTGEASMKITKISDFRLTDMDEADVTDNILSDSAYSLMIVNYKVHFDFEMKQVTSKDTTFVEGPGDSIHIEGIKSVTQNVEMPVFRNDWKTMYESKILPLIDKAESKHMSAYVVFGGLSIDQMKEASRFIGLEVPVYQADETILKTVIRSNPGIILWKNGKIIKKWHINKAPEWAEIEGYMKD
ncbi:MAG TPA: DoxX family membrane protein [Saprospiraceae bacterium]|nr:DoxX family membrane protein [Saprospiraceae bacterium]